MKKAIVEWYTKNRRKIWLLLIFIMIIVAISVIVGLLSNNMKENNEVDTEGVIQNTIQDEFNYITVESDESVISGSTLTSRQVDMLGTIEEFIEYCNNANIQEAYNLLSDECKDEMYSTIDDFEESYYNQVFAGERKNITVENWVETIFRVTIQDDFLSTGVYAEENTMQDYISVIITDDGDFKLNINGYISRKDVNKTVNQNDIEITVLRTDTYMDYQIYTFKVTNNTQNDIILDDMEAYNTMYLEDENGVQYSAYTHELASQELELIAHETKEVKIKYYNKYGSTKNIKSVNFSKIKINYDSSSEEGTINDYISIGIEL